SDLGALLAADYRFHSSHSQHDSTRSASVGRYVDGLGRADELKATGNLFDGVKRNGLIVMPGARSIAVTLDGISEAADPEHRDSTGVYGIVAVRQFLLRAVMGGENVVTPPSLHVFHLVRGDAAVREPGQPGGADRWYLRRWLEDVDGLTLGV